jgi:N-acetyl sugar amidotransferase
MKKKINCKLCLFDSTNSTLNNEQICNYCLEFESRRDNYTFTVKQESRNLDEIKLKIVKKKLANSSEYDAILGLSGGVDSSYCAYLAKKIGLNLLLVHLDNSWNSDIAVQNVNNIIKFTKYDYDTLVIDWEEFKDLQKSFIKAGVIDIELLTDHAIFATLLKKAKENNISYILSGSNYLTEHGLPDDWIWFKSDSDNIIDIHKKYGEKKLKTFPIANFFETAKIVMGFGKLKIINILDKINYKRLEAITTLESEIGWKQYGDKHHESHFTKFYQGYILPKKFKVDKRISHLSCLIRNKEVSKEEAVEQIKKPLYLDNEEKIMINYICKKFEFTEDVFQKIINEKPVSHSKFKSQVKYYKILRYIRKKLVNSFIWKILKKIKNNVN